MTLWTVALQAPLSDSNRLNYGKTYTTEPVIILLAIVNWPWLYAHLHSLSCLMVCTSPVLQRAQPNEEMGSLKLEKSRGLRGRRLLWSQLAPMSWECLIKDLLAWPEPFSPLFQISVVMRQEPRKRNKLTWQIHGCGRTRIWRFNYSQINLHIVQGSTIPKASTQKFAFGGIILGSPLGF